MFFPLRTSVELFAEPSSPDAVTKTKEAAVLYDEVIFEAGLLDVAVTPNGSTAFWTPPQDITAEQLLRSRRVSSAGAPMTLAIRTEETRGVPAEKMHVMFEGRVSNAYVAEFHTGILDELESFKPDWVAVTWTGGESHPGSIGDPVYEAIRQLNFSDLGDAELMAEEETFLRSYVYGSFNRDAVVATALEASFVTTPLFGPMVARGGVELDLSGREALSIVVGDLGALPWEAVFEFRAHHGSEEARERLREFECLAVEQGPRDANEFLRGVAREVNKAYRAAVEDLAPSLPEELGKQILLKAVEVVSVVGIPVAAGSEIASTVSASRSFSRSWTAALMKLSNRLIA